MPETRRAKPIIKVYLLPAWNESQFQVCFNRLVNAAKSVSALKIDSASDLIILFSQDAMVYGSGSEILVEVDLPMHLISEDDIEQRTADAIHGVLQGLLPEAYVQCKIYPFSTERGYRSTAT
jgi:hypothetical protein